MEFEDVTGTPRPERDILEALRFAEAEMITNPARMGAKNTGSALIHYVTIRDALKELLILRELLNSRKDPKE
jgi:hypothetical protein